MKSKCLWKRVLSAAVSAVMALGLGGVLPGGAGEIAVQPIEANAISSDFTQAQAVQWARDRVNEAWCVDFDGNENGTYCQCVDLIKAYYDYLGYPQPIANARDYATIGLPEGWIRVDSNPQPGDISCQGAGIGGAGEWGHVGIVTDVDETTVRTAETNWPFDNNGGSYGCECHYVWRPKGNFTCFIRPNFKIIDPTPIGHEMDESEAAGQKIPDGEYYIFSGVNQHYYLDVSGSDDTLGKSGTNVNIWTMDFEDIPSWDTWKVTYLNNGFYRIQQNGADVSLDVSGGDQHLGTNVQVWENHNGTPEQWSINKTAHGYTIQSRRSSYFLDLVDGAAVNENNIRVWEGNDSKAQSWCFVPYKPDHVVEDGIYRIHSAIDDGDVLDAAGNVGEYKEGSNIQIWNKSGDDVFQITHDANGYYFISEVSSGLVLDADVSDSNYLNTSRNIVLYPKADQRNRKWAILKNDDGTYRIISQLNGYCMDLVLQANGIYPNGVNVNQYPYEGNPNQRWTLESVTLNSIKVDKNPDRTTYFIDEKLDPAGIIVNAKYSGDYSFKIAKGLTYQYDFSTPGEKTVKVSYKINGKTMTDSFKVTVSAIDFKGSGTKTDPYLIESKEDLEKMRTLINHEEYNIAFRNCYYLQTADINLNNEKWTPIGKAWANDKQTDITFQGHYDGGQHWIHGLNAEEKTKFSGLFGRVFNGTIENLAVDGTVVSASDNPDGASVGGIVGEIQNATVSNCCFIGDVTGNAGGVGGIVGYLWQNGIVDNCYHVGIVKTSAEHSAGGVVGRIQSNEVRSAVCTVENCYHVGKMDPAQNLANTIVGYIDKAATDVGQKIQLKNCYGLSSDGALCAGDNPDTNTAQAVKESVLKLMAPTLGDSFVKNSDSKYLDGYPVFPWQTRLAGDVNADGAFDIADAVLIHKWLLTIPDTELANWEAGDMNADGKLDVRDLSLMKQDLLNMK